MDRQQRRPTVVRRARLPRLQSVEGIRRRRSHAVPRRGGGLPLPRRRRAGLPQQRLHRDRKPAAGDGGAALMAAVASYGLQEHYIDGAYSPSGSGASLDVLNPATNGVLATVACGGPDEIELAVSA